MKFYSLKIVNYLNNKMISIEFSSIRCFFSLFTKIYLFIIVCDTEVQNRNRFGIQNNTQIKRDTMAIGKVS